MEILLKGIGVVKLLEIGQLFEISRFPILANY